MSDFRNISSSLPVGKQSEDESPEKSDGPEPHNGLLNCYEGTNITEEKGVKVGRTLLIDALIESKHSVKRKRRPDVLRPSQTFWHYGCLGQGSQFLEARWLLFTPSRTWSLSLS